MLLRPAPVLLRAPRALERPDVERPRALEPPARVLRVRFACPDDRAPALCVRPRPPVLRFPPRLAPPRVLPPLDAPPRWRPPRLPPDDPRELPPDEPRAPRPTLRERLPPRLDAPRPAPRLLPPRPPCLDDRLRPLDCLAICPPLNGAYRRRVRVLLRADVQAPCREHCRRGTPLAPQVPLRRSDGYERQGRDGDVEERTHDARERTRTAASGGGVSGGQRRERRRRSERDRQRRSHRTGWHAAERAARDRA
jgi:hypothetical protein